MTTDDERFKLIVSQNLRAERVEAGYTQQQIENELGFARTSMSYVESGRTRLSLHRAAQIAKLLGIKIDDLVEGAL